MKIEIIGRIVISLTREPIKVIQTRDNWFSFAIDDLAKETLLAEKISIDDLEAGDLHSLPLLITSINSNSDRIVNIFVTAGKNTVFAYKGNAYLSSDDPRAVARCLLQGLKFITPAYGVMYLDGVYPNSCLLDVTDVYDFNKFAYAGAIRTQLLTKLARSGEVDQDIGLDEVSDVQARQILGFRKNTCKIARVDDLWVIVYRNKSGVIFRYSIKWLLEKLGYIEE